MVLYKGSFLSGCSAGLAIPLLADVCKVRIKGYISRQCISFNKLLHLNILPYRSQRHPTCTSRQSSSLLQSRESERHFGCKSGEVGVRLNQSVSERDGSFVNQVVAVERCCLQEI